MNYYKLTFFLGFCLVLFVLVIYDNVHIGKSDNRIELKLLENPPPGYGEKLKEKIVLFEKTHPNIKIKLIRAPGNYYVKVQTMMVGNTCADVLGFTGKNVNAYKIKGTLLNLFPFIKRDNYDLADYFEVGLKDAQTTDEEVYYLPREGSGSVLFYNKDLFDQAGLKYPNDKWTWQDFLNAAIALTKDTDGDGRVDQVGYSGGYWWPEVISWVLSNGGDFVNDDQTKCLLNKPEAIEAMNFLLDLDRKYHVTMKSLGGVESAGLYENFASGRIGMIVSLAYALSPLMDSCKNSSIHWDISTTPKGKCGGPNRYTSSGWVIWSGTKHPEEAWELLKFLNSPEVMKDYCYSNHYIPARKSIGLSEEYLNRAETWYDEKILVKSLLESNVLDNVYAMRSIVNDLTISMDKARLNLSDIQTEMDKLVEEADIVLKEYSKVNPLKLNAIY